MSSLLVFAVASAQEHLASAQGHFQDKSKIPKGELVLGSSLEQIVDATERCTIENKAPCNFEEYSAELTSRERQVIEAFWLDRFEVSQESFARCVAANQCEPQREGLIPPRLLSPQFPMIMVKLRDAIDYCRFKGGLVPSEAHYELAAAGPTGRLFPWGNLFHHRLSNFGSRRPPFSDTRDGVELLAPVDAFAAGASPQGISQLAGNVAEWTTSPFEAHGDESPRGRTRSPPVVVKGGSFRTLPVDQRTRARRAMLPTDVAVDVGFRCMVPRVIGSPLPN